MRAPAWPAAVLAALGLVAAVAGAWLQARQNRATEHEVFLRTAARAETQVRTRMQVYEYGLRGARGAVIGAGGERITRAVFARYVRSRDLAAEFPGTYGFGFIRRVPRDAEADFVAATRAEGADGFDVHALGPAGPERYVIQYVEPAEQNRAALGLDIATEPHRREAALRARTSARVALTAPIQLIQAVGTDRTGFLVLLPVYRGESQTPPPDEREDLLVGWVYTPFTITSLLDGLDYRDGEFSIAIADVTEAATPGHVYVSAGHGEPPAHGLAVVHLLELHGRTWQVEVHAHGVFVASLRLTQPAVVGAAILAVAALLAALLATYLWHLRRHLQLSGERDRLAAIVDSSDDAILARDLAGKLTSWNQGATRMLGHTAAEVVGLPIDHVLRRGSVAGEARLLARDGREVPVSIAESPIRDRDGATVAHAVIARDITRSKQAEAELRASESRFRALAEALPQLVWTCTPDGACDYLSPQWVDYTGVPQREQLGDGWLAQLHPDDVAPTLAAWRAAVAAGTGFDVQFRIRGKDGAYRWFQTRAAAIRDEHGAILKWVGGNTDVQHLRDAEAATARQNQELEARVAERTAELGTSTRRLEAAQRLTHVGSWELHVPSGRISWSEELFRIFGLDPAGPPPDVDEMGRMFTPESTRRLREARLRCITTGEGYELSVELVRPDGQRRVGTARAEAERGADGQVELLVGTFQDETEMARVREALRVLSERLQLATSAAQLGIWDWNIADNVLVWDETMHRIHASRPETFPGTYDAWKAAVHPDDLAGAERDLAAAVAGPRPFVTGFRIVRPDGEIRHLRAAAAVQRDAAGEPVRMIGVNWDVTEQRVAELALRRSEALQRGILAHAGSVIIATDLTGTITLFNRAAEEMLGYTAAEVVQQLTPVVIHDADEIAARARELEAELGVPPASPFDVFVARARQGRAEAREWTYVRKDGSRVPVLLTVTALRDESEALYGYLGVAVDLTVRKQHERQLLDLNRLLAERTEQAESASRAKSRFLASTSHEIRTPMNAITGVSYLLARTELSPEQSGLVATLEGASRTLLAMLNDILDLSKIEAQQLRLEPSRFALAHLVDEVAALMTGLAGERDLDLSIVVDENVPAYLVADRLRLGQILANLVGNAVKLTESGFVRLRLALDAGEPGPLWLRFAVEDSGPGIPAELLPRLFTPFTQGPRRRGGTGLGLAIVRELVSLMGGEVGVETEEGRGSVFAGRVTVERGAFEDDAPPLAPVRLLVVDAGVRQREALVACARRLGWPVEAAAALPDPLPTLGVLVVDAPPATPCPLPTVVAVPRRELEARRAAATGPVDAWLGKPVTETSLAAAVATALGARGPGPARPQRLSGYRLLVVDDNQVNQVVASRILALEGASVETAGDGLEAVARADAGFDAILMDIQMPGVDGIEATRRIRARLAHLPIIALTAGALADERQAALLAGMSDFISKPFDPDVVVACVRRHLARPT